MANTGKQQERNGNLVRLKTWDKSIVRETECPSICYASSTASLPFAGIKVKES
jgi:hypothetical protein